MKKIESIKELRKLSNKLYPNEDKELINIYENKVNEYNFGVIKNYIINKKLYEVFIFVQSENDIASSLLSKLFKNKLTANLYYSFLKSIIGKSNKNKIFNYISFFNS